MAVRWRRALPCARCGQPASARTGSAMQSHLYMGVRITPDSFENPSQPGQWMPCARLEDAATGTALDAVSDDEPCGSRADADTRALRMARRSLMKRLHQG